MQGRNERVVGRRYAVKHYRDKPEEAPMTAAAQSSPEGLAFIVGAARIVSQVLARRLANARSSLDTPRRAAASATAFAVEKGDWLVRLRGIAVVPIAPIPTLAPLRGMGPRRCPDRHVRS